MTAAQLALKIGSKREYITKLENKTPKNPSREKLLAIAKALNISVESLYSENDFVSNDLDDKVYFEKFMMLDEEAKIKVKQIIDIFA